MNHSTCTECGHELREGVVICHVCGRRVDLQSDLAGVQQRVSTIDYIFVRIHHWSGVNLLGVLLLLIGAFGLWGAIELVARLESKKIGIVLVAAGVYAPAMLDIIWRLTRGNASYGNRLLSPLEGGCFVYLPIWVYVLGLTIFVGYLAVSRG